MRACWANPSNCWKPHFRRARSTEWCQSSNAFRCNPLSSKYKKAAVESLPPEKATRKKSYSAKSGTL